MGGDPEATGGAAGLGLSPDAQAEEVLGREEVKDYLKVVKVRFSVFIVCLLVADQFINSVCSWIVSFAVLAKK